MARLTGENIEQYRPQYSEGSTRSKTGYFSLKDDKEVARGRLLYNSAEDIEGFTVHRVKVGDYERPVNCLVERDGSPDDCPFCKAGIKKQTRVYIPVFNEDANDGEGQIQIWDRPNTFYGKVAGLCARYPNIVNRVFDIERRGERGYQKTDYDFYPIGDADGTTIEDILADCDMSEMPKILGNKYVLDKSASDMEYYLDNGEFPATEGADAPVRRRSSGSEERPVRRGRDVSARSRGDRF